MSLISVLVLLFKEITSGLASSKAMKVGLMPLTEDEVESEFLVFFALCFNIEQFLTTTFVGDGLKRHSTVS